MSALLQSMRKRKPKGLIPNAEGKKAILKRLTDASNKVRVSLDIDELFHWHRTLGGEASEFIEEMSGFTKKLFHNPKTTKQYLECLLGKKLEHLSEDPGELLQLYYDTMLRRDMDPRILGTIQELMQPYNNNETFFDLESLGDSNTAHYRNLKAIECIGCIQSLGKIQGCSEATKQLLNGAKLAYQNDGSSKKRSKPLNQKQVFSLFGMNKDGKRMRQMTIENYRSENAHVFEFLDMLDKHLQEQVEHDKEQCGEQFGDECKEKSGERCEEQSSTPPQTSYRSVASRCKEKRSRTILAGEIPRVAC